MHTPLERLTVRELLSLHAAATEQLRVRGVVRTANNPVGDYAEWLVATALGLDLSENSASGVDAIAPSGERFQIKGRRVTKRNPSRQLSVIRCLDQHLFDSLAAVVFDDSFEILTAVVMPHEVVTSFATYRSHVNGHVLHVRGLMLLDPRVLDITATLAAVHC